MRTHPLPFLRERLSSSAVLLAALVALLLLATPALTQDATDDDEPEQPVVFTEEVVVTGTRAEPRSITESIVPIDVISADDFQNQGDTDLSNLLRTLAPSYNVNTQPISDASTIVRPATLRNLAPDHTLVLVNGKRRHRAAVIYWLGNGVADGAQGPDISVIPSIALRQVEVLRDGASAQYGSDAIAGVMNFLLKDDSDGGSVEVRTGSYAEGDGDAVSVAANFGLPLGENGYFNVSAEYGGSDPTDRSVQRDDAAALIAAGNTAVANPAQVWGSPEIEDDTKVWFNFGKLFDGGQQFYGHANYAEKTTTGGFYFRNPNTRGAVFSADGGQTLLIGDLLDAQDGVLDGSANCPVVRITNNVPDPAALAQVFNNPNCFSFQELFPGGFTPNFGGDVEDYSLLLGLRGRTEGGIGWDFSISQGSNEVDFFIRNTVNASLGPNTPTEFDPGLYKQDELNFNFDVTYALNENTNIAGGVEWRDEQFEIGIGQLESYQIGPLAAQGFSAASNGFPGFGDIAAGSWSRSNYALYGDLEIDADDDRWTVGAAVRLEDFEDFGSTLNGKLAGRYEINEAFSVRGSVSSGFRAPTPGQSNAFNVSTEFDLVLNDLVNNGTIPSSSRVAQLRGGEPLEPETAINYAAGFVWQNGAFTLTTDLFHIEVSDRLAVTQNFSLTPEEVEQLIAEGITSAGNLANFRFFANDFDTETTGIDVVATYDLSENTDFSLLFNHTETDVVKFNPETLDQTRIMELEGALPETRWSLTGNHFALDRKLRLLGRINYFDGWFDSEDGQNYGGEYIVDLEAAYTFNEAVTFVLGAQNALDTYPEENPGARGGVGNLYSQFSPFGFNGAFYYARVKYSFDFDWN
ncbi:MAG: TonB-dependent receptor [Acidobacteria bacterium]|nr:MAG: TonB-dependent receptor [Acidobacteriota bacterium]REK11478.1 MAG: TonB-dependent receptor [Acidobacteriota bacterium]